MQPAPAPVSGRFALYPLAVAGAALLLACSTEAQPELAPAAREPLQTISGPLVVRHLLSGELVAEQAVEMMAPQVGVSPLQIRWLAENGTQVEAGDVVLEFDNSQLVGNLEQLEANAVKAAMTLETARSKAAADVAEAALKVFKQEAELEKASIAAAVPESLKAARDWEKLQLARQRAELELAEARRRLETARVAARSQVEIEAINLEQAEQRLRHAEEGTERLILRAPRAGIVVIEGHDREDRTWQEGDTTFPGRIIARLPELESLIVAARLFDVDDGGIASGLPATVTLDAFPDRPIPGRVRRIETVARQPRRSLSRVFEVLVDLAELDLERMRPGMSAKVVVESTVGGAAAMVLAPREAITVDADGGPAQLRLAGGGWQEVEIGVCSARFCIVDGIAAGTLLASAYSAAEPSW